MGLSLPPESTPTTAVPPVPRPSTPRGLVHELICKATAGLSGSSTAAASTLSNYMTHQSLDPVALRRRGYAPSSSDGGLRLFVEPQEKPDSKPHTLDNLGSPESSPQRLFVEPQETPVNTPHTLDTLGDPELSPQGREISESPHQTWTQTPGEWTLEHLNAWGMAMRQGNPEVVGAQASVPPSSQAASLDAISFIDLEAGYLGTSPRQELATELLRRAARGPIGDGLLRLVQADVAFAKPIVRLLHAAFLYVLPVQDWPSMRAADHRQETETPGAEDRDEQSESDTTPLNPMMAELQLTSGIRRRAARSAPYDQSPTRRLGTRPIRPSQRRLNRDTEY